MFQNFQWNDSINSIVSDRGCSTTRCWPLLWFREWFELFQCITGYLWHHGIMSLHPLSFSHRDMFCRLYFIQRPIWQGESALDQYKGSLLLSVRIPEERRAWLSSIKWHVIYSTLWHGTHRWDHLGFTLDSSNHIWSINIRVIKISCLFDQCNQPSFSNIGWRLFFKQLLDVRVFRHFPS